ncbi:VCBS repeat-containing protein [bacterium SCSIO 12696]|nr:VCBS repeat-containing protein [bacterium SCSIO 12696]
MGIKRAITGALLATSFFLAGSANAVEFGSNDYAVYSGNLNNDGCEDIYLKAKERVILITGDITTPILIPPAGSSYKILSSVVNSQCIYPDANILVDESIDVASLTAGSYQYVSGDFNNDGFLDVRLVPASSSNAGLTLAGGSTPSLGEFVAAAPAIHQESAPPQTDPAVIETDSVGTIAGNFRVDESGSATYSIPIATAAGTAGVAPQLSLNYSSQGGNGLVGLGWNIGGLSGITRSRQTLQQDGDPMPITWGPDDRFALDGQRLILVTNTAAYGAPDTEYRTEIDSFAKIYARGGTTGHPDYWEVHRKDGSTSYYGDVPAGNFTDAKQNNTAGQTLTWALKKFQDSVGNPIWFDYHNDANGQRIEEVKYAYGSAGGPSGSNARVRFAYGSRNDVTRGYVAGYEFSTSQRLTSVTSYNTGGSGETVLRTYHLTYLDQSNNGTNQSQPATDDLSRLTRIEECVDSRCLPATTFNWALPISGVGVVTDTVNFDLGSDDGVVDYQTADINGDGRLDLVWLRASVDESDGGFDLHELKYALADSNGFGALHTAWSLNSNVKTPMQMKVMDYNADGRVDVLIWDKSNWRLVLSEPQNDGQWRLSSTATIIHQLPTNDTYDDLAVNATPGSQAADIDGDGIADTIWLESRNTERDDDDIDLFIRYQLSSEGSQIFEDHPTAMSKGTFVVTDYNGDGHSDVLVGHEHQMTWLYLAVDQGGNNWRLVESPIPDIQYADQFINIDTSGYTYQNGAEVTAGSVIADVTSDGLADFVRADGYWPLVDSGAATSSSTPYQFGTKQSWSWQGMPATTAPVGTCNSLMENTLVPSIGAGDFNGDGVLDFIGSSRRSAYCEVYYDDDGSIELDGYGNHFNDHQLFSMVRDGSVLTNFGEIAPRGSIAALRIADLNADGLSDVLYITHDNKVHYRFSNGSTFEIAQYAFSIQTADEDVQLVDYNRDGYPDFVWYDSTGTVKNIRVRYWNGAGFDAPVLVRSNADSEDRAHSMVDANSDGILDHIEFHTKFASNSFVRLSLSTQQNVPTNRITSVTNGLGAETNITYGTLATSGHYQRVNVGSTTHTYDGPCFPENPYDEDEEEFDPGECEYTYSTANVGDFYSMLNGGWDVQSSAHTLGKDVNDDGQRDPVLELNGPMYVVTDVASSAPAADDANPGTVNNNATSSISYYYGEAKVQAMGRGFLGFQRLRTVDNQTGVITTTSYRQDFPFIGSPLQTTVTTDDGHVLSMSENIWKLKHWNGSSHTEWSGTGMPATKLYAPYLARSIEKTYDLASNGTVQGTHLQTVTTDNVYDSYGNPLTITVTTDDETGSDQFVKTTTNTYGTSTWEREMGRLSRTQVVSTRSGSVADTETRTSAFTYITSGDKRGLLATEVIEPDNVAYRLTTTYQYDNFGNKLRATTSGAGVTSRYSRSEYDALGRYVERSFNSLEQKTSEVVTRNGYGQVTQARDLNGLDVVSAYSPLGRKYFERGETGGFSKTYLTDADTSHCPTGTVYKAISHSAGGGQSQQCFDKLGRAIRSLSVGFSGNWIASDVEFDTLGRTKRQSEPYYLDSGSPIYWTTIDYDILGRPTTTTLPDNSTGSVQYNGYSTVTINDKGHRKVETKNALGEVVGVTDNEGGSGHETSSVSYAYDAQGNMTTMTDSAGNVSTIHYDLLGRKDWMDDPDKGYWTYSYNVYGELESQTDANGQTSTLSYDVLGRLIHRIDRRTNNSVESDTQWHYNNGTSGLGLGLLNNVQQDNGDDGTNDYVKTVTYDTYGRVTHTATALGAGGSDGSYIEQVTYDQYGRTYQTFDASTDPTGATGYQGTQSHYNAYGYMDWVGDAVLGSNGQPRSIYRTITSMDARGNVTGETRGDNVSIARVYDPQTGRIETIDATHALGAEVQDLEYEWDTIGNLEWREEKSGNKNLRENFGYDDLNRLTSYQVVGQAAKTVQYDALGNILYKSDVGTYSYGTGNNSGAGDAGVHAVTQITGAEAATYSYDDNGNNLSGDGRTIVYSTFDKPLTISKGSHTTGFQYGPDRARYKRTDTNSSGTKTTLYVGNTEWITQINGDKEIKRHLGGTLITLKLNSTEQLQSVDTHYQYHDHLGSLDVITDETGAIVQEMSFDAWGERRDATDWTALANGALTTFDSSITTRGFTGHEMLDEVGVIHMNGRIYDPKIARFLQADPFIQDPTYTQSLNRYSYTWNNPLNATDPSGYISIRNPLDLAVVIVAIVVEVVCAYFGGECSGQGFALASTYFGGGYDDLFAAGAPTISSFTSSASTSSFTGTPGFAGGLFGRPSNLPSDAAASRTLEKILADTWSERTGGKYSNGVFTTSYGCSTMEHVGRVFRGGGEAPTGTIGPIDKTVTQKALEIPILGNIWEGAGDQAGFLFYHIGLQDNPFNEPINIFSGNVLTRPEQQQAKEALAVEGISGGLRRFIGVADELLESFLRRNTTNKTALPDEYWIYKRNPNQVTPGTRTINDVEKPSSSGGTYHQTTHYDEFGREVGRTDRTTHGREIDHPNPHHHRIDPVTRERLKNTEGSRIWPGLFGS